MSRWPEKTIFTNNIKINYYRTGGDKPPVVINHGAGDDGLCWTRVVQELEADYDVIMPDMRGHGKSDSGHGDYTTQQRVADLAGLINTLKLDRPVVGGHSMGADSSLNLASEYPHIARAIFLEDPPIFLPGEPLFGGDQFKGKDVAKMMRQFMSLFKKLPRFMGLPLARKMNPSYTADEIIPIVDANKRLSSDFINSMSMFDFNSVDPLSVISKIEVPVLLIIGDKEKMSIVSTETANKAAQANSKVQIVHLKGASHNIRRTRFDGYMPALKQFLKEVYSE